MAAYSLKNIEDWDFRECYIGSPAYDAVAAGFLGTHFTKCVVVDSIRLDVIVTLVDADLAQVIEPDRRAVRVVGPAPDALLAGVRSNRTRLTKFGRLERRVIQAMRREHRKNGELRATILPPTPGFQSD